MQMMIEDKIGEKMPTIKRKPSRKDAVTKAKLKKVAERLRKKEPHKEIKCGIACGLPEDYDKM